MKIITTYFAKLRTLPDNIVPISICSKAPTWYNGLQYKKLAPRYEFFMKWKRDHDNDYYIKCFNEQVLSPLDPKIVVEELMEKAGSENIALVCYEKPGDFCHRHLVAEWLNNNGYTVEEFKAGG